MPLSGGFLITPSKMGALKFVYYISLFAYSLRSLVGRCRLTPGWKQLTPRLLSALETKV